MSFRSIAVAACAGALVLLPAAARAGAVTGPQVGAPAPAFALKTIDGRNVTLDSYRGKTLVINAWATWCPPCRQETADLIASYRALHVRNVEFLGVDSTEEAPIVRAFVASKGVPYAQAIDADKSFSKAYDIRYFPTTYVIDPSGIVRARYIDVIAPPQLRAFVAAAQAGRDGTIVSKLQSKIDDLLAIDKFSYGGDTDDLRATVKRANAAIEKAEQALNESDPAKGDVVDFLRVRAEEVAVRDRAIAAFEPYVRTDADRALLARMKGDAASEREHWTEAIASYDEALAVDPKDADALSGLAAAAGNAKQYDRAVAADEKLAQLAPSPDAYVELGNAYKKLADFAKAGDAFDRAVVLARAKADARPNAATAIRKLAWVYLYQGRLFATAGDKAKARSAFANLTAWTLKLPRNDERYAMYLEEAQEATVALDLDPTAAGKTAISLTPWTGPDLPGSIASTIKYRLVVAAASGKTVTLRAFGLPKRWIASFCTDRVCSPFKVVTTMPSSGVKVIEFQVVPDGPKTKARPTVRVQALDGSATATTSVIVAVR